MLRENWYDSRKAGTIQSKRVEKMLPVGSRLIICEPPDCKEIIVQIVSELPKNTQPTKDELLITPGAPLARRLVVASENPGMEFDLKIADTVTRYKFINFASETSPVNDKETIKMELPGSVAV